MQKMALTLPRKCLQSVFKIQTKNALQRSTLNQTFLREYRSIVSKSRSFTVHTASVPLCSNYKLVKCLMTTRRLEHSEGNVPTVAKATPQASAVDIGASVSSMTASEELQNLDDEMRTKLQVIQLEHVVWQQTGYKMPDNVTDEEWLQLLHLPSMSARLRFLRYIHSVNVKAMARQLKKEQRAKEREAEQERRIESGEPTPRKNTFFMMIRNSTMSKVLNSRIAHAMVFENPVVLDLGFEQVMRQQDIINLVDQILDSYGYLRKYREPFYLSLCNMDPHGELVSHMRKCSLDTPLEEFMFETSEKSYLDLYPKDKLVYLTPNANDVMTKYDFDKIYIVGGLVDKSYTKPITMAKAKEEGITMQKLPLDYFLRWKQGTKSLTINQVLCILLELKATGDWEKALRFVPTRKILRPGETLSQAQEQQQRIRAKRLRFNSHKH